MPSPPKSMGAIAPRPSLTGLGAARPSVEPSVAAIDAGAAAVNLGAEPLAASMEAALRKEDDRFRRFRLHHDLGSLYASTAGGADFKRAAGHFLKAHELQADNVSAIRGARRALLSQGKNADAVPLFEAELAQCSTPAERARLLYEEGQLLETRLKRKPDALDAYQRAVGLDAKNLDALRAAARLERELGRFGELDRTLEQMAAAVEQDPSLRAALIAERARLSELRLDAPGQGLELYLAALALDPDVGGAGEAIKRLSYSQGQWRKLVQALEQESARAQQPAVAAAAQARMAEVLVEHLSELDEGIAALRAAVAQLPDDRVWLSRLAELLTRGGRHAELLPVLEQQLSVTTEVFDRVELSYRMGEIAERELQDIALAERHYLQALEIDPGHQPVRTALRGLYARSGQQRGLLKVYQSELEFEGEPAARADLLARLGEIEESGLDDAAAAVERYKAALALVPDHGLSLRALDRLLPGLGRFEELAEVYERVVDHAADAAQAKDYLMRIGAIREDRLGDFAAAIHAYERILERDERDLMAMHALQRAADRASDYGRLLQYLDREAQLLDAGPRWADLMYRAACVAADRMEQPALAVERLRRLLEVDGEHRLALRRLSEIYRREQRWDELLTTFEQRLSVATSAEDQATLATEMGRLCELQIGRVDDAVEHYARALDADPGHLAAHRALLSALRKARRHEDLTRALQARIDSSRSDREVAHLAFEQGMVYEQELDDPKRALAAYARALTAAPDFRPAADARSRLVAAGGDYRGLSKVLREEAEATAEPWLGLEALFRAAAVEAELLGDTKAAMASYTALLERAPSHLGAMLALEGALSQPKDRQQLGGLYERHLGHCSDLAYRASLLRDLAHLRLEAGAADDEEETASGAYRELLELSGGDLEALQALIDDARSRGADGEVIAHLSVLAGAEGDPMAAARHHLEVAERYEQDSPERALPAYRMALALDAESLVATRGLSRVALALGEAGALSEAARRERRVGTDSGLAVTLFLAAARAHRDGLDTASAVQDLEQALDLEPASTEAARLLIELLQTSGELARLCELLSRAADRCGGGQRAAELYTEVASLRSSKLGDLTAGINAAERALSQESRHVPALQLLAALLNASGQWARAASTLETCIEASTDRELRARAQLALARLAIERLGDLAQAERSLKDVLRIEPDNREALALMGGLHQQAGRIDAGLEIAARLVETASDEASRAQALLALARGQIQQGKLEDAEQTSFEALGIQGPGSQADASYRRQIGEHFSWERYIEAMRGYMDLERQAGRRVGKSAVAIAGAQLEGLRDAKRALLTLEEASRREPDDPELWDRYARLLLSQGGSDRAVEVYRAQLAEHPEQATLWAGLAAAHEASGRQDEAAAIGQPLLLLDAAEGEQRVALTARQAMPVASGDPVSAKLLGELDPMGLIQGPAAVLAHTLLPVLSRLHPADLGRYGVSRRDRVAEESNEPLRMAADRVARCVGASDFDLYVHQQAGAAIDVVLSEPIALMVPRSVATLPKTAMVFQLTRALFMHAHGLSALDALDPHELAIELAATVRRQQAGYGEGIASAAELDTAEKAVSKAIPWLSRKKVDDAAAALASAGAIDLEAWIGAVRGLAARVGLLLCDDVVAALSGLQAERGQSPFQDALGRELLRLWAGDIALRHRQQVRAGGA